MVHTVDSTVCTISLWKKYDVDSMLCAMNICRNIHCTFSTQRVEKPGKTWRDQ
jgi:hypothetical protein